MVATQTDWRTFFPDPRLHALIEAALEHNRDLRIAVSRIAEARAQHGVARADFFPSINLGGKYNTAQTPRNLGGSPQTTTGQSHDVSLSVISYEVDFWGRISGLADSARASYLATEEAARAVRLSLVSDVAGAYFNLLERDELIGVSREIVETREKTLALVAMGRDAGYATVSEYLQAENALLLANTELATRERERAVTENLIRFLVGRAPETLPPSLTLSRQVIDGELSPDLPAESILARPDVLASEQRLLAAHANIGAARSMFLPRILLTGLFGTASKALTGLFAAGTNTWTFQPTISMPLFDGGRITGNVDLAEARKVTAVAEYEKTIQQAFREVADLLVTRSALKDQLAATERSLKIYEERLSASQTLYKGGAGNYLSVLDAERDLLNTRLTIIQMRRTYLSMTAQLYKALGGGG